MSTDSFGYKQELKRSLTFADLVIYGIVFMIPIAPFAIYGYVSDASGGDGPACLHHRHGRDVLHRAELGVIVLFVQNLAIWSESLV
ncbi:hypothetical protein BN2475_510026 [Paraburkholderia ribeironis]|uniref:Uncharacterized protein n=1 Tax=Paraburkholderia ribeironis TaxID=1247936 RepID=A0A1N7SC09_9BURK|nr:hypothetical protein [Paraburkholderia ribeironis]SIT44938.1 hypothetical protein BN2475_510026 [Paraburkholderia ribeironis]